MTAGSAGTPLDVLVIGGGQAGLAMGYHLAPEPAAQTPTGEIAGGFGDKHLPAVPGGFHPGAAVDRRVIDTVAAACPRLPGVQPHPHVQAGTRRPRLRLQGELARAGRLDRGRRTGKDHEETVPLPAGGDHDPAMPLDHLHQQTVVPLQRHFHRLRHRLPQPGRPLDIGQQECDRPGRQIRLAGLPRLHR
jgi:hypothetical protein